MSRNLPSPSYIKMEPPSPISSTSTDEISNDDFDAEIVEKKEDAVERVKVTFTLTSASDTTRGVLKNVDRNGKEHFKAVYGKPQAMKSTELVDKSGGVSEIVGTQGKERSRSADGKPQPLKSTELLDKPEGALKIVDKLRKERSWTADGKPQTKTELLVPPRKESFRTPANTPQKKYFDSEETTQPSSSGTRRSEKKARNENVATPEKRFPTRVVKTSLGGSKRKGFDKKEKGEPSSVCCSWEEVGMESGAKPGNEPSKTKGRKTSHRTPKRKCVSDEKELAVSSLRKKAGIKDIVKSRTPTAPKTTIVDENETAEVEVPRVSTSGYNLRGLSKSRTSVERPTLKPIKCLSRPTRISTSPNDGSPEPPMMSKRGRKRKVVDASEKITFEAVDLSSPAENDFDKAEGIKCHH